MEREDCHATNTDRLKIEMNMYSMLGTLATPDGYVILECSRSF